MDLRKGFLLQGGFVLVAICDRSPRRVIKSEGTFYYVEALGDMSRCCWNCGSRSVIVPNRPARRHRWPLLFFPETLTLFFLFLREKNHRAKIVTEQFWLGYLTDFEIKPICVHDRHCLFFF
ncbi:hypothetical protein CDAR_378651 [Caerostris darwini]|uniref:Uncharacterized protein n=1 Tax=Caerostris darwini TaxID=1538125 RepID=A0AAV4MV59_9ARAC|nr:hypothetical protein CDAR_378651 [Caerostris darwini]